MRSPCCQILAVLGLLLLPLLLLWPCLLGDRVYVPWDIAQFPPASTYMDDADFQAEDKSTWTLVVAWTTFPTLFFRCPCAA